MGAHMIAGDTDVLIVVDVQTPSGGGAPGIPQARQPSRLIASESCGIRFTKALGKKASISK